MSEIPQCHIHIARHSTIDIQQTQVISQEYNFTHTVREYSNAFSQ